MSDVDDHRTRAVVDETDLHVSTEPSRLHLSTEPPKLRDDDVDQRFSKFRASCGDPARSSASVRISVQRELTDDQYRASRIRYGLVHHTVVIVHHPKVPNFVRQLPGMLLSIGVGSPNEHEEARTDLTTPNPLTFDPRIDPSLFDPLHETTHSFSIATTTERNQLLGWQAVESLVSGTVRPPL